MTAVRGRHGLAGLLVVLFAFAGLIFTYGLGQAPPPRPCMAHEHAPPVVTTSHTLAEGPVNAPPFGALDTCLCLAVLLALLGLGLAQARRPVRVRRPRAGWFVRPPNARSPVPLSLTALQVLRL